MSTLTLAWCASRVLVVSSAHLPPSASWMRFLTSLAVDPPLRSWGWSSSTSPGAASDLKRFKLAHANLSILHRLCVLGWLFRTAPTNSHVSSVRIFPNLVSIRLGHHR